MRPLVGIGVIILNKDGKVLIGKRKGSHAPYFSIPGGHLELGESFEEAAIKEIKEETNLDILNPKVICLTNNLETYSEEGKHYISVILFTKEYNGTLKIMEPEKCECWQWCELSNLPQPHFEASEKAVNNYINDSFYTI